MQQILQKSKIIPKYSEKSLCMSHQFAQQLIHIIWSTDNQQYKIPSAVNNQLYAYISTVIKSKEGKLYLAGGSHDHIHCLISLPPTLSISAMMRMVKSNSSKWIKHQQSIDPKFAWEDGYTAISVQHDRVDAVCTYIKDEGNRHEKMSYKDELSKILALQNIAYDEKYFLSNTHSKILLHLIWSTKNRIPFLDKSIRPFLYTEMANVVSKTGGICHSVGGIEDHVHLLIETSRNIALSDLINEIKVAASHWISLKGHTFQDFEWQIGYGAFSISLHTVEAVKQYIMQQEEHHKKATSNHEWNEFILNKGLPPY